MKSNKQRAQPRDTSSLPPRRGPALQLPLSLPNHLTIYPYTVPCGRSAFEA